MKKLTAIIFCLLLLTSCATVEVETGGWKVMDAKGMTADQLAALQAASAPQKVVKFGGYLLLETKCKAKYNTFFRGMQQITGQVCGATAQADQVASEVDLNAIIAQMLLRSQEPVK